MTNIPESENTNHRAVEPAEALPPAERLEDRKLAKSMFWTVLESLGMTGISFATLVILAHQLLPTELGSAALALSIVSLLTLPVEALFQDALVQRHQISPRHFNTAATASIALGILLSILCWWSADLIAAAVNDPQVGLALGWMSCSLPASGLASVLIAKNRRELHFDAMAVSSIIGRIIGGGGAILLALLGAGLWAPVAQQILSAWLAAFVLLLYTSDSPRFGFSKKEFEELFRYGIQALSTNAIIMIAPRLFMLQIGTFLGTEVAGYFNLAFRTVDTIRDVTNFAIWRLIFPLFLHQRECLRQFRQVFSTTLETTTFLTFPIFAGLAAVAPDTIDFVFGEKWLASTNLIIIMCVAAMIHIIRLNTWAAVSALGKPLYPIPGQLIEIGIVSTWPFLGEPSIAIAATIWLLKSAFAWPMDAIMLRRATELKIIFQLEGLVSTAAISAFMAGGVVVFSGLMPLDMPLAIRLSLSILAGAFIYLALTGLFKQRLAKRLLSFVLISRPR